MEPDRIVLGGMDARSIQTLERVYEVFLGSINWPPTTGRPK